MFTVPKKAFPRSGFTLVELIIVIIILGILAALAIPQFTTSTQDAVDSTLAGNLAVVRNAIQLYYHQHQSTYPGAVKEDGTGTATAAADNPAAFVNQLLQYTKADGETSEDKDTDFPYGPYLQSMPANPINGIATVAVIDTDSPLAAADIPATAPGWLFSKNTGESKAVNDAGDDLDPR